MDTVGVQEKDIALAQFHRTGVDVQRGVHAHGANQVLLLVRDGRDMVFGELGEGAIGPGQPVDPAVTHMKNIRQMRLDNDQAQRADIAPGLVGHLAPQVV